MVDPKMFLRMRGRALRAELDQAHNRDLCIRILQSAGAEIFIRQDEPLGEIIEVTYPGQPTVAFSCGLKLLAEKVLDNTEADDAAAAVVALRNSGPYTAHQIGMTAEHNIMIQDLDNTGWWWAQTPLGRVGNYATIPALLTAVIHHYQQYTVNLSRALNDEMKNIPPPELPLPYLAMRSWVRTPDGEGEIVAGFPNEGYYTVLLGERPPGDYQTADNLITYPASMLQPAVPPGWWLIKRWKRPEEYEPFEQ